MFSLGTPEKNTANNQRKKTDKAQAETLERILFCESKSVNTIPIIQYVLDLSFS